jgi:hypothetical protein
LRASRRIGQASRMAKSIFGAIGLLVATTALLSAAGCHRHDLPELSVDEVAKMVGQPNVFVIDANTKEQYQKAHLPGAKYVAHDAVTQDVLPSDKEATLIFYCKNTF